MSADIRTLNKQALKPLRKTLYNYDSSSVEKSLKAVFHPNTKVQLAYRFETLQGADGLFHTALEPLHQAIPDLERRDTIVIAGPTWQSKY
jgi:hypothetical protein